MKLNEALLLLMEKAAEKNDPEFYAMTFAISGFVQFALSYLTQSNQQHKHFSKILADFNQDNSEKIG